MRKKLIIAGRYAEAVECAKQRHWKSSEWKYANDPQNLDGICNCDVVRFGNWRTHRRIKDIERKLMGLEVVGVRDEMSGLDPMLYGDGAMP